MTKHNAGGSWNKWLGMLWWTKLSGCEHQFHYPAWPTISFRVSKCRTARMRATKEPPNWRRDLPHRRSRSGSWPPMFQPPSGWPRLVEPDVIDSCQEAHRPPPEVQVPVGNRCWHCCHLHCRLLRTSYSVIKRLVILAAHTWLRIIATDTSYFIVKDHMTN